MTHNVSAHSRNTIAITPPVPRACVRPRSGDIGQSHPTFPCSVFSQLFRLTVAHVETSSTIHCSSPVPYNTRLLQRSSSIHIFFLVVVASHLIGWTRHAQSSLYHTVRSPDVNLHVYSRLQGVERQFQELTNDQPSVTTHRTRYTCCHDDYRPLVDVTADPY